MTRYFDVMREVIEFHGGAVEKFIGDAVMAVFGVPTVHEDDALRACRAALEIHDRLVELDESHPSRARRQRGVADGDQHRRGRRRRRGRAVSES